jgi:hypothetical protein
VEEFFDAMNDQHDLVLCLFALVIAAVMLVAGELYLITQPDPTGTTTATLSRTIIVQ